MPSKQKKSKNQLNISEILYFLEMVIFSYNQLEIGYYLGFLLKHE